MKLRYKILSVIVIVLALGIASLAILMSHTSACGAAPPLPAGATPMKAVVHRCYGSPDVVRYEDVPKPAPAADEVLVKVHAASVNPLDWHHLAGTPYLVRMGDGYGRPEDPRMGVDFAGTVEAVGAQVRHYKPGDEVFGGRDGAFAEFVTVHESHALALKPSNVSFEQAAAVPIAALTALQALRDVGHVRAGQKVLINGASGGVGLFAVQLAKAFGTEVTGVTSTRNLELVRSLGADHVIDYTREDFTQDRQRYDLILDNVSTHSLSQYRRVLTPTGRYVMVGSAELGNWFSFFVPIIEGMVMSPLGSRKYGAVMAQLTHDDLAQLAALMQAGKVTPFIDRRYKLADAAEAMRYLETGHARGKVVLTVD
jgi:NADPH:quinone reductase-like Zn-dependent oxidoreductase